MSAARFWPWLLGGMVVAVVATALGLAICAAQALPDGPVDLVWDKVACAHCRMHVGEPAFAAQLTTTAGETLAFDDPGCLFEYEQANHPAVHASWFRHHREDRWLRADAVGFVEVAPTPMGYGLGAVEPGTAGAIGLEAARAQVLGSRGGAR
jgi:copper chaperone NosL